MVSSTSGAAAAAAPAWTDHLVRRTVASTAGLLALLLAFAGPARAGTLLPPPQWVRIDGAALPLSADVGLEGSSTSSRMTFLLSYARDALMAQGFAAAIGSADAHAVSVRFQKLSDPQPVLGLPAGVGAFAREGEEGYVLSVTPSVAGLRVVVASSTDRGLWNGAMTLRQLLLANGGGRETSLAPQLVRDYPDQPVRAALPVDLGFTTTGGGSTYVVTAGQIAILDALAQQKTNVVIFPSRTLATTTYEWAASRTAFAALQRAADDRFIELVPSLGTLQSDWAPAYRDGWWIEREPMIVSSATRELEAWHFPPAGRRIGDVVVNGGFESGAGAVPESWTLSGAGLPGASFTRDSTIRASGAHSMRLDASGGNAAVVLSQSLAGPFAAGHYLVSAMLRTQAVTGLPPRLTARAMNGSQAFSPPRHLQPYTGSYEWDRWSGILRIPKGSTADAILLAASWDGGSGSFWIDDVRIERIDSDLRNVMRDAKDLVLQSADGSTVYTLGPDYTVVPGEFSDVYSPDLLPTRVLRPAGSRVPLNTPVLVSYDKNLYPGLRIDASPVTSSRAGQQGLNLCAPRTRIDLYQPALARLLWDLATLNPDLPVRRIFLAGDEIRGFNRSGACRDANGALLATNAQRLADFLDELAAYAELLRPDVELWMWGDMLSPGHSGGAQTYQVDQGNAEMFGRDLGGAPGVTYCALDPEAPGCAGEGPEAAMDAAVRPVSWWSNSALLFQKEFSAAFFSGRSRPFLLASTPDAGIAWDQGIRDLSALSVSLPESQGFLDAFDLQTESRALKASLGWNAEHTQVFYEPFEFPFSQAWGFDSMRPSPGDYTISNGNLTFDESCASPALFEPQQDKSLPALNAGGVCLLSPSGSLRTPFLPVQNSLRYRVSFQSRAATELAGSVRVRWRGVRPGEWTETYPVPIGPLGGGWRRSSVEIVPRRAPGDPYVSAMSIEIQSPGSSRIDDLLVWEERPGCPLGDVVASATPIAASAAGVGSTLEILLSVSNAGCRDLVIGGVSSDPVAMLGAPADDPFPIIVSAGATRTVRFVGVAPALAPGAEVSVALVTNDPSSPTVVSLTLSAPPACGLLGAEVALLLGVAPAISLLRARRTRPGAARRRGARRSAG